MRLNRCEGKVGHMLPIVGGNWNNGSNAGMFNRNWNNYRSNSNNNVGFRSAFSDYGSYPQDPLLDEVEPKGHAFPVASLATKSANHQLSSSLFRGANVS